MESDTPRTDALVEATGLRRLIVARQLERELAAAIKQRDEADEECREATASWNREANETLDLYRELDAMRKQRDEATAWRPIESAPMDGTVILLYGDRGVTAGSRIKERLIMVNEYHHSTGEYLGSRPSGETEPAYWGSLDGGFTEAYPPTHWMPLPQPPREKEGGGA